MLGLHFGSRKDIELLNTLTKLGHDSCQLLHFDAKEMADRIGLKNEKDLNEFIRIVILIREGKEAEWSFYQLKDWFKV